MKAIDIDHWIIGPHVILFRFGTYRSKTPKSRQAESRLIYTAYLYCCTGIGSFTMSM